MSHRKEKRARKAVRLAMMTAVSSASLVGHSAMAADEQTQQTAPPPLSPSPTTSTKASEQSTKSDELQEIVVTGYRASLESALDAKRSSDLPIESIQPEDIGKMPDQNVAESLQRLPGIQIDRGQAGQGTQVLIDGLRQNLITLNGDLFLTGREFYVSGEASGGGAGANAQYSSLEGIPSDIIGGIDVFKAPAAAMLEGGLGGIVDIKTINPLAQPDGLSLSGNFRESRAQTLSSDTPDGTVVGTYKFNDRFAITGSFTFDDETTHTKEFQDENRAAWLVTNSATGPYSGALTPAGITTLPQSYIDPQLGYFTDSYDYRDDKGASISIAGQLTDTIVSKFNWFYLREDDTNYSYSDKAWFNGQGSTPGEPIPGIDPTKPYSIDGNGVVRYGTFNANGAETATLYQNNISQANNFQWITKFNEGGPLRGDFDAAFSHATSNLQADQADVEHGLYDTSAGIATSPGAPGCNNGSSTCTNATGSHGYEFNYANGGTTGLPSVSYPAPYNTVLSNPATTTFKSNWAWSNQTDYKTFSVRSDLQWDPEFVKDVPMTISGGVRYAGRDIDQTFGRYLINGTLANGQIAGSTGKPCGTLATGTGPYLYYQDPGYGCPNIPFSTAVTNPNLAVTVPNFAVGNIIVKNPTTGGMSNPSTYLQTVWAGAGVPNTTEQFFVDHLSSFSVTERTTTTYAMVDLGKPANNFHVNFGVRLVNTDLTINGGQSAETPTYYGTASWNGVDSNVVPVQTKRNYTDVLPQFNFVLDVTPSQLVRFSAARVSAPTDLFSLGLGNSYNFTRNSSRVQPNGTVGGFEFINGASGNPNLNPYRASQFSMSYENYFAPGALASIGTFYKQVDSFVEIENIPTFVKDDFGGTTGNVTQPVNAGQGRIYGIELSGQYAFGTLLADWMQGFGIVANYTYSQSQTNTQTTSFSHDSGIPGVSRDAVTGTFYYERFGFSARTSYSWRDRAVNDSQVGATFPIPDAQVKGGELIGQVYQAPYGQLDAQVGYDFNVHVGVFFSAQNLTNSAQHTYLQWTNLPFSYDQSGRRLFLGVKGKL